MTKLKHIHPEHQPGFHVHHGHHHHEHGDDCTCEHCMYSHHGATFHLHMDTHDGASIVSANGMIKGKQVQIQQTLPAALKHFAGCISSESGIIGHIKSAIELRQTEVYSITLDTVNKESSDTIQADITLNAIVFGISTERLEELLKDCLQSIAEIHCSI